jgi:hypothetical protein
MTRRIKTIYYFGIWFLIVLLAGVTAAATSVAAQDEAKTGLKVTVLLYSGRPNPTFVLDDKASIDKVTQLLGKSNAIAEYKRTTVVSSRLGFNGVVVENLNKSIAQFPASLAVNKGTMEVKDGEKKFMTDEGRELENYLLSKAVEMKVIDENALRKIKEEK